MSGGVAAARARNLLLLVFATVFCSGRGGGRALRGGVYLYKTRASEQASGDGERGDAQHLHKRGGETGDDAESENKRRM